jgi:hypothetical protein
MNSQLRILLLTPMGGLAIAAFIYVWTTRPAR